jgi:hypothetical protein
MALKTPKSPLQTETTAETITTETVAIAALDIENLIADSLIQDINWQKVRTALIDRARQKFWVWLSSQLLPTEPHQTALNEIDAIAIGSSEVES